jgi:hypothetical protein
MNLLLLLLYAAKSQQPAPDCIAAALLQYRR